MGKTVVLIFREGMQEILKERLKDRDYSENARTLRKAAQIIRHDIFEFVAPKFSGSFTDDCQENSVPTTLKTLASMLLYGNSIKNKEKKDAQATLSIAQLVFSNCKKRISIDSEQLRNNLDRETPLQIFLGTKIHVKTRSKVLIQA